MACNCSGQRCACNLDVADTFTVDMTLLGSGSGADPWILSSGVRIDPDGMITVTLQGLLALASVADGSCVSLSGDGSPANPLTPEAIISPDAGNVQECRANGLFVPAVAAGAVQHTGQIDADGGTDPQTFIAAATNSLGGNIDFVVASEDVGGVTDIANSQFVIPGGGTGYYLIEGWVNSGFTSPPVNFSGGTWCQVTTRLELLVNGSAVQDRHWERYSGRPQGIGIDKTMYLTAGDKITIAYSETLDDSCGDDISDSAIGDRMLRITQIGV